MAEKRVKLKSSDDEMFEVEEAVALEAQAVKNVIEDTGVHHPIPLPNVSSKILAKVIEYCQYHVDNQKSTEDRPATMAARLVDEMTTIVATFVARLVGEMTIKGEWTIKVEMKRLDEDFVKVDQATLFELILAADYLNTQNLLELTCRVMADRVRGKTREEICKIFNIEDLFIEDEDEFKKGLEKEGKWDEFKKRLEKEEKWDEFKKGLDKEEKWVFVFLAFRALGM
jgi:S-phase kinase-associated protein 1